MTLLRDYSIRARLAATLDGLLASIRWGDPHAGGSRVSGISPRPYQERGMEVSLPVIGATERPCSPASAGATRMPSSPWLQNLYMRN